MGKKKSRIMIDAANRQRGNVTMAIYREIMELSRNMVHCSTFYNACTPRRATLSHFTFMINMDITKTSL